MNLKEFLNSLDIDKLGIDKYLDELGYKRCAWDNSCDCCDDPENGAYVAISGYEYREVDFEICGKCAEKEIRSGNKGLEQDMIKFKPYNNIPF